MNFLICFPLTRGIKGVKGDLKKGFNFFTHQNHLQYKIYYTTIQKHNQDNFTDISKILWNNSLAGAVSKNCSCEIYQRFIF